MEWILDPLPEGFAETAIAGRVFRTQPRVAYMNVATLLVPIWEMTFGKGSIWLCTA